MTRVMLGDFSALHRLGFESILRVDGVELVGATGVDVLAVDVLAQLVEALPDVVVLDLDRSGTDALVRQIVHRFPTVKIVACSSEQPMMRVFPPLHYGESYTTDLDPVLFTSAIKA